MPLPPLYKYMGVQGAKLTLGNRTFRHAKPSTFNDVEDMTIQSLFPIDVEAALEELVRCFDDVILRHLNDRPTCSARMCEIISQIQQVYRLRPGALAAVRAELHAQGARGIYNIDAMRQFAQGAVMEINQHFQLYRVLCVSTQNASEKLWSEYAENHSGIALRIEPNLEKDSKFRLFRSVTYREQRPPLYRNVVEFVEGALFGDQMARAKAEVESVIYSKTTRWAEEHEYRLAAPFDEGEDEYLLIPFHAEEITELYLGSAMRLVDMSEIVFRARTLNPDVVIFQVERMENASLGFRKL